MRVADVMTTFVLSATPSTTLRSAMQAMEREEIRHLPIIDDEGILGVLSYRMLRSFAGVADTFGAGREEYEDLMDQSLESVLQTRFTRARDVFVVAPEESLRGAIALLLQHKLSAIPVVNDDGRVVGIVSYVDMLEALEPFADE